MTTHVESTRRPQNSDHVRGLLQAPIRIVEYGDFECLDCANAYKILKTIQEKYGLRVSLTFRHFPMPIHASAMVAAEAAEAASRAGRFWEMHDRLLVHRSGLSTRALCMHAEAIGIDPQTMLTAIATHEFRPLVQSALRLGTECGVTRTPTVFINGARYEKSIAVAALSQIIDRILHQRLLLSVATAD